MITMKIKGQILVVSMGQLQKRLYLRSSLHPPCNFGLMLLAGSWVIKDHISTCCQLHNLGSNFDNSILYVGIGKIPENQKMQLWAWIFMFHFV